MSDIGKTGKTSKFYGWGDSSSEKKGGGINYKELELKLEPNKKYRVRFVGNFAQYIQHWEPIVCRSPEADKPAHVTEIIDPLLNII